MIDSLKMLVEKFDCSEMDAFETLGIKCKTFGFVVFEAFYGFLSGKWSSLIRK
jgi:hypothetical protein